MAKSAAPIVFRVSGQSVTTPIGAGLRGSADAPALALPGELKAGVRVGARRAGGAEQTLQAVPGEDVVVLHIANGPALVLHPETARDLLLGQGKATRSGGTPGEVAVPAQLRWSGLEKAAPTRTRGFLGDVLLSAVEVFTGLLKAPAATWAAKELGQRIDGAVAPGVYALRPEALGKLAGGGAAVPSAGSSPILVMLHGTFVDTVSTFGKLWVHHPHKVREMFDRYEGRVHALDHPTLGTSPVANALALAEKLPDGARLHLASHSRGGLVAEVLARVAARPKLTKDDLAFFAGTEYAGQRADLQRLSEHMQRGITVERVVRVACPARGTLLASRRLDAYLSVLKWSLELGGVPVAPALVDFLAEVARRRADPELLPGLAAMIPDNPLVQWLNQADGAIDGQLRVVAGDLEGDSVGSWLKTLAADAFYWTDNDVVVQTRSMYGGAPRKGGASFLLDQGGRVTHFNYFTNARTVDGVVGALVNDQPAGFRPIGPLSWAGEDASGLRAARRGKDSGPAGAKPAVFVLPGILGSHLAVDGKRIWLGPRLIGGLKRLAWKGEGQDTVTPDGPIGLVYDDLMDHLAATHEVIPFAFDWRRPIEEEAQRLADSVSAALDARQASGQPVRLLAHSMGGIVARTMQLERPEVWDRLMAHKDARLVMLGTPNGGSWAPMQVLSGDDTFGNALAAFGAPLQDRQARQLMASMPGFIQLQADLVGLPDERDLGKAQVWQELADRDLKDVEEHNWWHRNWLQSEGSGSQLSVYKWGVPPQEVLDRAKGLRERLNRQRDEALPAFADKLRLVVGNAEFTPDGYTWTDGGLVYRNAVDGGDGRVTHASALMPGVRTWTLDNEHGTLPDAESAFDAFTELLVGGKTDKLLLYGAAATGRRGSGAAQAPAPAPTHVYSRPSRGKSAAQPPADGTRAVLSAEPAGPDIETTVAEGTALRVTVLNGNLSFVRQPLLLGHYRSLALTGTERVINGLVGGAMTAALEAGLYPEAPGSQQVFVNTRRDPENPWRAPRPEAAIVVGLGEEGELELPGLVDSVRQGVIAWSQRLAEAGDGAPTSFELATTLVGSGGIGISPGGAACAIAKGVREANVRLEATGWPVVTTLTLVELFLDRASEAWHGLRVMATAAPGRYEIAPAIASGTGPLRRPADSTYRGADYDLISASSPSEDQISFALDTKRARTEVRAVTTQGKLVRELVLRASHDANDDPQIGRTLFQLLVPQAMEPFLGGTAQMLLELDAPSAAIPWELLDLPDEKRGGGDHRPWALRSRLLRRLRTEVFQTNLRDACADDDVLVIGEPKTSSSYEPLPGARAEARAVAAELRSPGGVAPERVTELADGQDAMSIVNALMSRRWRIVHIAGHGEPGREGGVVLSDGLYLGAREIDRMRTVPELVFVNCCYLAQRQVQQVLTPRGEFAAGVADALIALGVRCVIAAGWAVEDEPARIFATRLYRELLNGQRFLDAVAAAREACWAEGGNTWAAYQCYGDPDWIFRRATGDSQAPSVNPLREFAGIGSPVGLAHALEALTTRSQFEGAKGELHLEKIRHLDARFGAGWGGMGAVAEAFGVAYAAARDMDKAVEWYARAVSCNDGSASMKASEQLGNLRARLAWEALDKAGPAPDAKRLAQARKDIGEAIDWLERLVALQPTIERLSLCAAACKRLAMLEARAGDDTADNAAEQAALQRMTKRYAEAEALARANAHPDLFYPAMNRMAGDLVTRFGRPGWAGFDAADVAAARASLQAKVDADPDFWSWVGQVELDLYEALAAANLAKALPGLLRGYTGLQERVAAQWLWASVADQVDFVLPAWSRHASAAERKAGTVLRTALAAYAGRTGADQAV